MSEERLLEWLRQEHRHTSFARSSGDQVTVSEAALKRLLAEYDDARGKAAMYLNRVETLEGVSHLVEKDASRYQWLRSWSSGRARRKVFMQSATTEGFDAAIDAEIERDMAAHLTRDVKP